MRIPLLVSPFLVILCFVCLPVLAHETQSADSAFRSQDYTAAAALYQAEIDRSPSTDAYYNLGNTYFRLKEYARSVLAYRRALWLDPANEDARFNLSIVENRLTDQFTLESPSFFSLLVQHRILSHSVRTWTTWGFFFFALCCCAGLIWRFARAVYLQKIGFYSVLFLFSLFVITILFALMCRKKFLNNAEAVVMQPEVHCYESPVANSRSTQILHEGSTVEIVGSSSGGWLNVSLRNGKQTWIKGSAIERVIEKHK